MRRKYPKRLQDFFVRKIGLSCLKSYLSKIQINLSKIKHFPKIYFLDKITRFFENNFTNKINRLFGKNNILHFPQTNMLKLF